MSNCNGSRGLLSGLLGECPEINIGCLQVTSGQPDGIPMSDQLPIRVDADTGSLWVWHCNEIQDSGVWLELPHNTLCDAAALNPTAVNDVCDKLQIPVVFTDESEPCEERLMTAVQFATQMKDCIDLRRICELDSLNQGQVDAAESVQIAACVDEEERLIPLPPTLEQFNICSLPARTQGQTTGATSVQVAACVDDTDVKIPYVPPVCSLPFADSGVISAATNYTLVACIDGVAYRVPSVDDLCESTEYGNNFIASGSFGDAYTIVCLDDGGDESISKTPWVPPNSLIQAADQTDAEAAADVKVPVVLDGQDRLVSLTTLKALLDALP